MHRLSRSIRRPLRAGSFGVFGSRTMLRCNWLMWALAVGCLLFCGAEARKKPDKAARRQATHERTVEASFKQADKDNNGRLSLEEYRASQWNLANPGAEFKKLDKNHDNALSRSEFEAGWPKKESGGGKKGGQKGGNKGGKKKR